MSTTAPPIRSSAAAILLGCAACTTAPADTIPEPLPEAVAWTPPASDGAFRVCVINPSMIVGPAYQPEPVVSQVRFAAILKGERFADQTPNSSMSMIDVRDLASLFLAAYEAPGACGRYFGVIESWHWKDIYAALAEIVPGFETPKAASAAFLAVVVWFFFIFLLF